PLRLSTVPLLEATVSTPNVEGYAFAAHDDLTWTADRALYERIRFDAVAYPSFGHGPVRSAVELTEELALPPGFNPRTLEWAAAFAREHGFDAGHPAPIVEALL